jgi:uncharacterized RDD family membrane protein YckC
MPVEPQPAPWLRRGFAVMIDVLVVAIPVGAVCKTPLQASIIGVMAWLASSTVLLALTDGYTLGKRLLGLRVVACDGSRIGWRRAILREIIGRALLDMIPGLGALDVIAPAFDDTARTLHDRVARTRVIRVPR